MQAAFRGLSAGVQRTRGGQSADIVLLIQREIIAHVNL
jgi:hypothetical protein